MKIITIADIKVRASEDNTIPTEEVAKIYGVTPQSVRNHKREHSDEILEGLHFIIKKNHLNKPATYWTLEGVYMVGLFIRSERAKKYRKAVVKLLKEIKQGNIQLRPQPNLLGEYDEKLITELIKRTDIVRGYQGTIKRFENELAKKQSEIKNLELKNKVISEGAKDYIVEKIEKAQKELDNVKALFTKPVREDKNFIYVGNAILPKNGKF